MSDNKYDEFNGDPTQPDNDISEDENSSVDDNDSSVSENSSEYDEDDYDEELTEKREKALFNSGKEPEPDDIFPLSNYDEDDDDDEDEDDDEDGDDYLQKFDETLKQNIISEYHPEMQQLNYSEVELLTVVRRDDNHIMCIENE